MLMRARLAGAGAIRLQGATGGAGRVAGGLSDHMRGDEATGGHRSVCQAIHARSREGGSSTRLRTRRFAEAPGQLAKSNTIDAMVTAAHGTTFLDLHTLPPRSAFLDQLADLLVQCERQREAQMWLRQSAMGVRDPVPLTEGQRCSCLGHFAGTSGSLEAYQAGDSCPGGPGVDVTRAPGSER